ncbi:hypothetical protein CDAR_241741 [Caerostris darwini]|uniref:Uncharacterized protein n=1 Tax=Caerostris darwini TaxID=1538125 RepID=A0AAV4VZU9_9ARAC|nr:hypothetical protein CDAR_241741 [Caerostris darwini]
MIPLIIPPPPSRGAPFGTTCPQRHFHSSDSLGVFQENEGFPKHTLFSPRRLTSTDAAPQDRLSARLAHEGLSIPKLVTKTKRRARWKIPKSVRHLVEGSRKSPRFSLKINHAFEASYRGLKSRKK